MKKKLFYDGIYSGHHPSYAKNILMSTLNSKLLVNKNMEHMFNDIPKEKIEIMNCNDPQSYKIKPIGWLINFVYIFFKKREYNDYYLYFLYGDSIIMYLYFYTVFVRQKVFITIHWANAVVPIETYRTPLHYMYRNIKFSFFDRITKKSHLVVHGDFTLEKIKRKYEGSDIKKIPYGIEEDKIVDLFNKKKAKNNPNVKILFFGGIRKDKGIEKLADLATICPYYNFLVAGKPNDYSKKEIEELFLGLKNVELNLEFITEKEMVSMFQSSDLLILPYEYYFSGQSGPLTIATKFCLPVVGTNVGDMGVDIKKHELGEVVGKNDPVLLKTAIEIVLSRREGHYQDNHRKYYNNGLWSKVGKMVNDF